jgi:hypothetical protein
MISISTVITDIVTDAPSEPTYGASLSDNMSSSISPDDTNMGYFWAIPSDAYGIIPTGTFISPPLDIGNEDTSRPSSEILGPPFGGISDAGGTVGSSLIGTPITDGIWSDGNAIVAAVNTLVQYWS